MGEKYIKFAESLVYQIQTAVKPALGIRHKLSDPSKISHDFQYLVDEKAEKKIAQIFRNLWHKDRSLAYVTEDQGLQMPPKTSPANIKYLVLIDPVDGSRPAQRNLQGATVTLTFSSHQNLISRFSDIELAAILDLTGNKSVVLTEKDSNSVKGVKSIQPFSKLSDSCLCTEDYTCPWKYLGPALDPLRSSVNFMEIFTGSAFGLLALAKGQVDIYADIRRRIYEEFPQIRPELPSNFKFLYPNDVAAGYFILKELGATITDAYGKPLDDKQLWQFKEDGSWDTANQITMVASLSKELHQKALEKIEEGFQNLKKAP